MSVDAAEMEKKQKCDEKRKNKQQRQNGQHWANSWPRSVAIRSDTIRSDPTCHRHIKRHMAALSRLYMAIRPIFQIYTMFAFSFSRPAYLANYFSQLPLCE